MSAAAEYSVLLGCLLDLVLTLTGCASSEAEAPARPYGPLSEFGYHDVVPMFTGEQFDPAAWAVLFDEAGARFTGMVAEHQRFAG